MKKLLCIILSLFILASCVACASTENDSSAPEESKNNSSESSASESRDECINATPEYLDIPTINGVKLSDFTIVYKENTDCLKFRAVAQELVDYVKKTYGVEMNLRSERVPAKGKELIIGLSSARMATVDYRSKDYGCGGYEVVIKGEDVILAASQPNGAHFGLEKFIALLGDGNDITDTTVEGSRNVVKVACVGDSIIQGINSDDNVNRIYPAYLQGMLGWDYFVLNAGISGYSIIKTDPYAYCKSAQYGAAKRLVPDVVLFSLGANDANPTPTQAYKDWSAPDRKDLFLTSTRELLDSFYDVNPDVQIILSYPSALCKNGGDKWDADGWNANIVTHVRPLLEQIVAEYEISTVDMWPWSLEHPEYFPDGLHPKDETYLPYAEYVYGNIKDEIKKPENFIQENLQ